MMQESDVCLRMKDVDADMRSMSEKCFWDEIRDRSMRV